MTNKKLKRNAEEQQSARDRRKFIRFGGIFLGSVILYYLISSAEWFQKSTAPLLIFYAKLSAVILNVLGYKIHTNQAILYSNVGALEIKEGCDAIAPAVLYAASVLAFPLTLKSRLNGLWQGILAIFILNIIRIVSLYIIYAEARDWFEFMHVEFWQSFFVVFTLVLFLYWIRRNKDQVI